MTESIMDERTTSAPSTNEPAPHWGAVWALSLGVASLSTAEMLPMSLLTPMAAGLGVTEGMAGQSVSASAIVAIITSIFIAPTIRSLDRRWVLLVLSAAQVLSNLAVSVAPTYPLLLAARLVLGLAVGGFWGLSASLALRLVPSQHLAKALSIIFGGGAVAGVVAAPLGSFFGGIVGWRGVFVGAAILAAIAFVTQVFTLPAMPAAGSTRLADLVHTLRRPQVAAGMLGVTLMFGGRQTFGTYLRPFLEQVAGFGLAGVSTALFVVGIATFAGTTLSSRLLARDLPRTLAAISAAMGVLCLALTLMTGRPVLALIVLALWSLGQGVIPVGWSTWLTRTIPEQAESGGGILVAVIQLAIMGGAALGGVVMDATSIHGTLVASAAVLLLGAVHVLVNVRRRPAGARA